MQTQETRIVNQCTYTPVAFQPDVVVPDFCVSYVHHHSDF